MELCLKKSDLLPRVGSVLSAALIVLTSTAFMGTGCSGGSDGAGLGSAASGGSTVAGSGGATQSAGSGGASFASGGAVGSGGMIASAGSGGVTAPVATGGVVGSGGAVGAGGDPTSPGTGGGVASSGGKGGAPDVGGRGGAGPAPAGTGGSATGAGGAAAGNRKAFIVITSKGTPTPGDMVMIGRIMAQGFSTVTPVTDAAVTAQSVVGADLVVISSSAESAPLQAKLKDIAIPTLVIEDAEFSKMGMASSGNHDAGVSQVMIAAGGSALVGNATGMVTIADKAGELGWGTPAATAKIGATMPGNPAHAAIFGYEKGAQMSGMAAPARRAGFAIREALAAGLNADGLKLFDAILAWVLL